jgi:hypothetical protein
MFAEGLLASPAVMANPERHPGGGRSIAGMRR